MPLIKPVPVLPLDQLGTVHFLAIGGAGMSGIAAQYAQRGIKVTGSDQSDSAVLAELRAQGIDAQVGHDPNNLGNAQTVVVSTAIRDSNVELIEAKRRGLRIWHRSTALAALMLERQAVAITGTHGKTTTSAMTAFLLTAAGFDPSWVLGAKMTNGESAHLGAGETFVIEADESDGSYLQYDPAIVCVTNIEADHLDNWITTDAYRDGFVTFASGARVETVVTSADDEGARYLVDKLTEAGKRVITFGESENADVRLTELRFEGSRSFARITFGDDSGVVRLNVPGRHNLHNFAAAFAIGCLLGADSEKLRDSAIDFVGTERRFQILGQAAGVRVVDDYAHHPTEVIATLKAARRYAGIGRVIACFQPHLFTRTRDFATEFGDALAFADGVLVTGIYPAREDPIPGVTGKLIAVSARRTGNNPVAYVEELADVPAELAKMAHSGDVVITIGAGSVWAVGPALLELLGKKA